MNDSGGKSKLAKKSQPCFNYGFGRVYMRVYKSGRCCWTIDYRDESGKRIQKALPYAQSKEEAAFTLSKSVAEAFDRSHGIERRKRKIGFTAFSEIYLHDYAMVTNKSWKTDAGRLKILIKFFKDTELRQVTPLEVERFRKSRLKAGNTRSTCNRYLALIKRMFNVAIEEGYTEENPVQKVKLYSEKDTLKDRILTEGEERRLLETCSDTLRPVLIIALNTGMRRAEIFNLQWSQVDVRPRRIRVEKAKSGKVRFIPVNEVLFYELNRMRKVNGQGPFVLVNPETGKPYVDMKKGFKAACSRAKIEGLRFHDLRHTFASRLVEKGVDVETVRDLLGHHCITITQRYTHSNDERKRRAVELLSGENEGKICDVFVTRENQSKLIN
jgi:integrase